MSRQLGCAWVGAVEVLPESHARQDMCHSNVRQQVEMANGNHVTGYYFIEGFGTCQAIRHSVWKNRNKLIDITPYNDDRPYIIFSSDGTQTNGQFDNCYIHSLDKYIKQENDIMYYVYYLVDPRDDIPFYVGKGTGNRASTHLRKIPATRNRYKENKIKDIRNDCTEPLILYFSENIIDEELAYSIEESMIGFYGRKGYDKDGILTNVCKNSRPPNHKGKSYEEATVLRNLVLKLD